MLNGNLRFSMPGLGIGAAAFALYVLYDQTRNATGKNDAGHH